MKKLMQKCYLRFNSIIEKDKKRALLVASAIKELIF